MNDTEGALSAPCCDECGMPIWRHDLRDDDYDGHDFVPEAMTDTAPDDLNTYLAERMKDPKFAAHYRAAQRFAVAMARIDALERLLVCYRTGGTPSEKLHRELARTRTALSDATDGFMPDRIGPDTVTPPRP